MAFSGRGLLTLDSAAALECEYFGGDPVDIARDLLGRRLVVRGSNAPIKGIVVETEAYGDERDPASHAAFRPRGRASSMSDAPGTIYVYAAYGIYPCLNIVTGPVGTAGAVLIRGVWIEGDPRPVLGPGRVSRALGVSLDDHGGTACGARFDVSQSRKSVQIDATRRVGIRRGVELPWRFVVTNLDGRLL